MRRMITLLLLLSCFWSTVCVPALALELERPQQLGFHTPVLKLQLESKDPQGLPSIPNMEILPTIGHTLLVAGFGAVVYGLSWTLLNVLTKSQGLPPSVRELGSMTLSVTATGWSAWALGNWANKGEMEGDLWLTLAGTLLGQSLFLISSGLSDSNASLGWLGYAHWSFSSLGAVTAYNLSRDWAPELKAEWERNGADHTQN